LIAVFPGGTAGSTSTDGAATGSGGARTSPIAVALGDTATVVAESRGTEAADVPGGVGLP
jgi:hypothetical protein